MLNKALVTRSVKKLQQDINYIKENGVVGSGGLERRTFTIDVIVKGNDSFRVYPDNIEQLLAYSDFLFSVYDGNMSHNLAVQFNTADNLCFSNVAYALSSMSGDGNLDTLTLSYLYLGDIANMLIYSRDILEEFINSGEDMSSVFIIKGSGELPAYSTVYKATFIIS